MPATTTRHHPSRLARRTGLAYLGIIATGLFAELGVRGALIAGEDPIATARNIATSPVLFGAGIGADLVMVALDVTVAFGLLRLLAPVSRRLALAMTALRLLQGAVILVNLANLVRALELALRAAAPGGAILAGPAREALEAAQRHALGYDAGLIAFGLSCLVLGRLLRRSGRAPRALALGLSMTGLVYLVGSSAALFAPELSAVIEPLYLIPLVAELALAVHLVTRGLGPVPPTPGRPRPSLDPRGAVMSPVPPVLPRPAPRAETTTMRAVVQDRYGAADVLAVREIDRPTLAEDEVLVRVHAAGVDRGVWHLMTGLPYPTRLAFGLRRPRAPVPGMDLAGVVEAVGAGVTRFVEGDLVFGVGQGTFAEYARASEGALAAVPHGLDVVAAGALAVSGSAALQAVEDHGRVTAGQRVLVLGASGGVGTYAVQIARALGAEVTGVASADKLDLVRALGARRVLDYRAQDALDGTERYDVIIDTGGNRSLRDLRRALAPTGALVIVGGEGGGRWLGGLDRQARAMLLSRFTRQRLTTFVAREGAAHLERLADLVETGQVAPVIDRRFPLDRVADAIRHLESGRARGKVVLEVRAHETASAAAA